MGCGMCDISGFYLLNFGIFLPIVAKPKISSDQGNMGTTVGPTLKLDKEIRCSREFNCVNKGKIHLK